MQHSFLIIFWYFGSFLDYIIAFEYPNKTFHLNSDFLSFPLQNLLLNTIQIKEYFLVLL